MTGSKSTYLTEASSVKEGGQGGPSGPGGPKSTFLDQPAPLTKGLRDPPGPNGAPVRDPSVLQLGPVGGLQIGPTNGLQLGATSGLQMGAVGGLQGGSSRAAPVPPPRGEVGITGSRRESLRDPPLVLPNNPPTRPSLRTESLERPPARERRLREATSGRCSAEPLEYFVAQELRPPAPLRSVTSLSELDLRNIDPDMAANLLQQIESGADMEPILLQLKNSQARDAGGSRAREKMVTFEEDLNNKTWDRSQV